MWTLFKSFEASATVKCKTWTLKGTNKKKSTSFIRSSKIPEKNQLTLKSNLNCTRSKGQGLTPETSINSQSEPLLSSGI